jgi:hypothetical protein
MSWRAACLNKKSYAIVLLLVAQCYVIAQDADTASEKAPISSPDTADVLASPQPPLIAYDTIAGPLPDTIFAHDRPYLVIGDIEVSANKTVAIEPGSVFLFKNFTGIHILGTLTAKGTKLRPIIFTSENDRLVNPASILYPNPYDWNGMYIYSSGVGSTLSNCNVFYSVYGIVSETKFIRLDAVCLRFNGKSNLVIEGKLLKVADKPYSYALSTKEAFAVGVPASLFKDPYSLKRGISRYFCYSLMMVSVIEGIESGLHYRKVRSDLKSKSSDNPSILRTINESDWISLRNERDAYLGYTGACGAAFLLGAIGFYWTFTF